MGDAETKQAKGSLRWIRHVVNRQPELLDAYLTPALQPGGSVRWVSPLESDRFAEYRDRAFLSQLRCEDLADDLRAMWPSSGPRWDALGVFGQSGAVLVEAKAHIPEMWSECKATDLASRELIGRTLDVTAKAIGATPRAPWMNTFFQLANRLAHLNWMRLRGKDAWLVLVDFVGDTDMDGPRSAAEWDAAYEVVWHTMGLPRRFALSRYIVHAPIDVSHLAKPLRLEDR